MVSVLLHLLIFVLLSSILFVLGNVLYAFKNYVYSTVVWWSVL